MEIPETIKTISVGAGGTSASVVLQNFNALMAALAALATLIYMSLKIYDWWKQR